MGSLADAAGKFAEKFADVLDVFDLSFFVAGSAALGALLIWLDQHGVDVPDGLSTDRALVAVIIAYVLGLASYTLGRSARAGLQKLSGKTNTEPHPLAALYAKHRLATVADFAAYDGEWAALYSRLWVLVRTEQPLRETYALVRRYWVLAAAYDGLAIAALLWLLPVWGLETSAKELPPSSLVFVKVLLSGGLVLGALMSWRQAKQYHRYQIDELAATVAHWSRIVDSSAAAEAVGEDPAQAPGVEDVYTAPDGNLGVDAEG